MAKGWKSHSRAHIHVYKMPPPSKYLKRPTSVNVIHLLLEYLKNSRYFVITAAI